MPNPPPVKAIDPAAVATILGIVTTYGPVLAELISKLLAKRHAAAACEPLAACPPDCCDALDALVARLP